MKKEGESCFTFSINFLIGALRNWITYHFNLKPWTTSSRSIFSFFVCFRSENESLAISPVRRDPGLALYQDYSVLSESTTSRFVKSLFSRRQIFTPFLSDFPSNTNIRLSMAPPSLPSSRAAAPMQRSAGPFRFHLLFSHCQLMLLLPYLIQVQHISIEEGQGGLGESQPACSSWSAEEREVWCHQGDR